MNVLDIDGNFAVDLAPENSHLKAMMRKHMQQKLKIEESKTLLAPLLCLHCESNRFVDNPHFS